MPGWLPSIIWLVLLVIFAVIEAATVGLVSIWFAIGALAALLSAFVFHSFWTQVLVFLAFSAVSLALLRPLVGRVLIPRRVATNADRVIGREGEVIELIHNLKSTGAVRVNGAIWTARSTDESVIPVGTAVTVDRIEGVKLFVTAVKATEATGKE